MKGLDQVYRYKVEMVVVSRDGSWSSVQGKIEDLITEHTRETGAYLESIGADLINVTHGELLAGKGR